MRQASWELVRGIRGQLTAITAFVVMSSFLESLGIAAVMPLLEELSGVEDPSVVTRVLDDALTKLGLDLSALTAASTAVLFFVLKGIAQYASQAMSARVGQDLRISRISAAMHGVLESPWERVASEDLGAVMNTVLHETSREQQFLDHGLKQVANFISVVVFLAAALMIAPEVTATALLFVAVLAGLVVSTLRRMRSAGQEIVVAGGDLTGRIREAFAGMRTLRAYDVTERLRARIDGAGRGRAQAHVRVARAEAVLGIAAEVMIVVVLIGLLLVTASWGDRSLAEVGVVTGLLLRIAQKAKELRSITFVAGLAPAVENVQELLRRHPVPSGPPTSAGGSQRIRAITLAGVSYSYPGSGRLALDDVSLQIAPGSFVGLVGPSGSGKSTVGLLLLRLVEPTQGELLGDGSPRASFSPTNWRASIGYVPQRPFLVNGSIADNIRFFRDIEQDEIWHATQQAALGEFIEGLPHGLETVVGDEGGRLSGGEQQRICLARALAGRPPILVLDEATSSLDSESEVEVQRVLEGLQGNITVLAIAHRLSTVMSADRVFVLEDGRVSEAGSPTELLGMSDGSFARMWAAQGGGIPRQVQ